MFISCPLISNLFPLYDNIVLFLFTLLRAKI